MCQKGYHPKKAKVLTLSQVNKFLNESDDSLYLAMKVSKLFTIKFNNQNIHILLK